MRALYEMTAEIKCLLEMLESIDQEDQADQADTEAAIRDTLEGIEMEFGDKAEAIVKLSKSMQGNIDAIDAELKRLQGRKKVISNRKEALIDYLKTQMRSSELKKVETSLFTVSLVRGADRVEVLDDNALPDDFLRVKTEISPDKIAIAKALKGGQDVPGARLVEGEPSLRIK